MRKFPSTFNTPLPVICRQTIAQCIFFPSAQTSTVRTLTGMDHKTRQQVYKQIIQSTLSDYNVIKLEITNRKIAEIASYTKIPTHF